MAADRKLKIKYVIAREGLIILFFVALTIIADCLGFDVIAFYLFVFAYPAYLLIKFLVWALVTVKRYHALAIGGSTEKSK